MPLPVIANVKRVVLNWQDSTIGFRAHSVFHVRTGAGVTPTQVFSVLDAHVTAGMWAGASAHAGVDIVGITPLDGVSARTDFLTGVPAKWAGSGGGDSIPQVATLVKFATGLRGPRHRGRLFIPYPGEGTVGGGTFTGAVGVSTAWSNFNIACATDATPVELGVASYVHADFNAALSCTAETLTGTQRRRMRRR